MDSKFSSLVPLPGSGCPLDCSSHVTKNNQVPLSCPLLFQHSSPNNKALFSTLKTHTWHVPLEFRAMVIVLNNPESWQGKSTCGTEPSLVTGKGQTTGVLWQFLLLPWDLVSSSKNKFLSLEGKGLVRHVLLIGEQYYRNKMVQCLKCRDA